MIKMLENGKVLVAHITIDNKNEKKEYIEDIMGSCLSPLRYLITPLIADLNYQKKVQYNGFMSIDTFIGYVKQSVEKKLKQRVEIEIKYPSNGPAVELYFSCDPDIYNKSTYSVKEFMVNVHGLEKMIVNVEIDKIDKENYYWFTHPKAKFPMY